MGTDIDEGAQVAYVVGVEGGDEGQFGNVVHRMLPYIEEQLVYLFRSEERQLEQPIACGGVEFDRVGGEVEQLVGQFFIVRLARLGEAGVYIVDDVLCGEWG